MKILDGVAPLADRYDGFILDIWGVLHDGKKPYAGVAEALGTLKAQGKRIGHARIGSAAIMHDTPEVQDEAVIAIGE